MAEHKYIPGYAATHIQNHSWRTAENSAVYLLPTLKRMVEAKPNLQLLDCGAGPGTLTASLAGYLPKGEVIATDLSSEIMERAAQHAKDRGVDNMKCQPASIYNLPFKDASFDIVHAQQVLCHLDSPLEALQSMLRVCRPGGIVAVREVDMRMWTFHPQIPALVAYHDLIIKTMTASGGDPTIGPRLVSLAMQAGVPRENIQASMGTWCYSTPEEREAWGGAFSARCMEGEQRKQAISLGLATADDMDCMAKAWVEWTATEDGCFGCLHGEIIVTKPCL